LKGFSSAAWKRLAPRVHSIYIPGTHLSAITTHVVDLAHVIGGFLSIGASSVILKSEVDEAQALRPLTSCFDPKWRRPDDGETDVVSPT
jgi:hypothetical protein